MSKVALVWMSAWACLAMPAMAGTIEPARYEGRTAIRVDDAGRILVTLDRDRDGATERLFLFAPSAPLPPGWTPQEIDATVEVSDSALRVSSLDGSRHLRFLVAAPTESLPAVSETPGFLVVRGIALADHDRAGLREALWSPAGEGIELVMPADGDCGGSDLDCRSGGLGSTGCDTQCGGGGVSTPVVGVELAAKRCGVSCADGYYSCCRCDASGPNCTCRSIGSVTPCSSTPSEPSLPN